MTFILMLPGSRVAEIPVQQWVIWNVGQGSFLTRIENRRCIHFDAGGERAVPPEPLRICKNLENIAVFSHSDWDHISYAGEFRRNFSSLCRFGPRDYRSRKHVMKIPVCRFPGRQWFPEISSKNSNDQSGVFFYRGLLYPGDSPKKMERFWLRQVPLAPKILVLAHHGSRTGTSAHLLSALPSLKISVVSSRKAKYGHPHPEVRTRLHKAGLPLISTESWGNIHFED